MNITCKKSDEYTYEEYKGLFQIFKDNMKEIAEKSALTKRMVTDEFQDEWINLYKDKPNIKLLLFHENEKIISYIIVEEKEKDNYIHEFQISKEYQKDGHTFKKMIIEGIKFIDPTKDFTGNIWINNRHSNEVFKHLGVKFDGKDFRMSGKMLMEWITK